VTAHQQLSVIIRNRAKLMSVPGFCLNSALVAVEAEWERSRMDRSHEREKASIDLALKIVRILNRHPDHIEAKSALTIAGELFLLGSKRGQTFFGSSATSTNKGLH